MCAHRHFCFAKRLSSGANTFSHHRDTKNSCWARSTKDPKTYNDTTAFCQGAHSTPSTNKGHSDLEGKCLCAHRHFCFAKRLSSGANTFSHHRDTKNSCWARSTKDPKTYNNTTAFCQGAHSTPSTNKGHSDLEGKCLCAHRHFCFAKRLSSGANTFSHHRDTKNSCWARSTKDPKTYNNTTAFCQGAHSTPSTNKEHSDLEGKCLCAHRHFCFAKRLSSGANTFSHHRDTKNSCWARSTKDPKTYNNTTAFCQGAHSTPFLNRRDTQIWRASVCVLIDTFVSPKGSALVPTLFLITVTQRILVGPGLPRIPKPTTTQLHSVKAPTAHRPLTRNTQIWRASVCVLIDTFVSPKGSALVPTLLLITVTQRILVEPGLPRIPKPTATQLHSVKAPTAHRPLTRDTQIWRASVCVLIDTFVSPKGSALVPTLFLITMRQRILVGPGLPRIPKPTTTQLHSVKAPTAHRPLTRDTQIWRASVCVLIDTFVSPKGSALVPTLFLITMRQRILVGPGLPRIPKPTTTQLHSVKAPTAHRPLTRNTQIWRASVCVLIDTFVSPKGSALVPTLFLITVTQRILVGPGLPMIPNLQQHNCILSRRPQHTVP